MGFTNPIYNNQVSLSGWTTAHEPQTEHKCGKRHCEAAPLQHVQTTGAEHRKMGLLTLLVGVQVSTVLLEKTWW
jgi:hypothetical protein